MYQGDLPVPFDHCVVNLPGINPESPPFVPQINDINPQMQSLLPQITGAVMVELQRNAGNNYFRMFLYNYMGQNNFQNQPFFDMVGAVCDYIDFLVNAAGQPVARALQTAVFELCTIETVMKVHEFPSLQQLLDHDTRQHVNQWTNHYNEIKEQVANYLQQCSQNMYPGLNHPNQGGTPYNPPGFNQHAGAMPGGWSGQPAGPGPQNAGGMFPSLGSNTGSTSSGPGMGRYSRGRGNAGQPNQNLYGGMPTGANSMFRDTGGGQHNPRPADVLDRGFGSKRSGSGRYTDSNAAVRNTHDAPTEPQQETGPSLMDAISSKKETGDTPKETKTQRKTEPDQGASVSQPAQNPPPTQQPAQETPAQVVDYEPARASKMRRTFTLDKPHSIAYDPSESMLFYVKLDNGKVTETLKKLEERPMEYVDHELDPTFALATKQDKNRVRNRDELDSVWENAGAMAPIDRAAEEFKDERELIELSGGKQDGVVAPVIIEELIRESSLNEAESQVEAILAENTISRKAPREYYFNRVSTYPCHDKAVAAVKRLKGLRTPEEITEELVENREDYPTRLWYEIHNRLTRHVNEILEVNLTLPGWEIESFIDDYSDLRNALHKSHGPGLLKAFDQCVSPLLRSSLKFTQLEGVLEGVDNVNDLSEEVRQRLPLNTISYDEYCTVTRLPMLAAEFNVSLKEKAGAVLESKLPHLHGLIEAIFERATEKKYAWEVRFRHHYILTEDGFKFKVHLGAMGDSFYILERL